MSNKTVVYVSPEPPFPVINGVRVKSYGYISHLVSNGYRIIFYFPDSYSYAVEELSHKYEGSDIQFKTYAGYRNIDYTAADYVVIDTVAVWPALKHCRCKNIYFAANDSYTLAMAYQFMFEFKGRKIARLPKTFLKMFCYYFIELYVLMKSCKYILVSDYERKIVSKMFFTNKTVVVKNGIDACLFSCENIYDKQDKSVRFVYFGYIDKGNYAYLKQFLGLYWERLQKDFGGKLSLDVFGKIVNEDYRGELSCYSGVKLHGYVDDIFGGILNKNYIGLSLVRKKCGLINKAIQTMAAGLPVVGFAEGLSTIANSVDNVHYFAFDDYASLRRAVSQLHQNESVYNRVAAAGRELVQKEYNWQVEMDKFISLLKLR